MSLGLLAFAVSLLTVFRPPTYHIWKLAIFIQETGHRLAFLWAACALLAVLRGNAWAALTFLVAAALCMSVLMRAATATRRLLRLFPESFPISAPPKDATGGTPPFARLSPLNWKELYTGVTVTRVIPKEFTYDPDRNLKLDFYPTTRPHAPCVVCVHGGGWDSGEKGFMPRLNSFLAARGYAVADLEYRLAPAHRHPAPREDLVKALAFLRERAAALGIDPECILLLGRSAGGQIALQAAYTLKDSGLRAVIAFYAPADMIFGYRFPTSPLIMDSCELMEGYLGGTLAEMRDAYRDCSPIEAVSGERVPTLMLHGRPDVLVAFEHSTRLSRRLTETQSPHFLVDLPWAAHGFDYFFSGPGSQISLYFLERFLIEVTRPKPASPR